MNWAALRKAATAYGPGFGSDRARPTEHGGGGMYADALRGMLPGLDPVVDDLLLLEDHQIEGLPERAPSRELAAVLHADPRLHRFLVARHPPIAGYLADVMTEHGPAAAGDLAACRQALVWELADWIA